MELSAVRGYTTRLVLIGELLRADETVLLCLTDVMQQCGLLPLAAEATTSEPALVRARKPTLHSLRRAGGDDQ